MRSLKALVVPTQYVLITHAFTYSYVAEVIAFASYWTHDCYVMLGVYTIIISI